MSVLPLPQDSIARVSGLAALVIRVCPLMRVPLSLKRRFGAKWTYEVRIDTGYIELCTGTQNYFPILDRHLLFCAFAVEIYDIYDLYMTYVHRVKDVAHLPDGEWKKVGEDEGLSPASVERIRSAVTSLAELDADSRDRLQHFLADGKKEREAQYGCYKGLSRADAFQPVAAAALGLRKDNFSIINDVIKTLQENRDIMRELVALADSAVLLGKDSCEPSALLQSMASSTYFRDLLVAALSRPLAVLTGNSGSGKTRLARRVAADLAGADRAALVPVGADWTDNRNVLGFVNHLRQQEGRAIYQSTPVLDLMLAAKDDPDNPYFLILDEMNLSHVERYFSDFLSKMESQDEVVLHSEGAPLKGSSGREVPEKLPKIPDNLFVIGTVNVDETTYMFSPKVLDRANVIEFRMDSADVDAFLATGRSEGGAEDEPSPADRDAAGRAFLELSLRARGLRGAELADPPDLQNVKDALKDLFSIMQGFHMEFAYRTMNEVLRYARVSYELTPNRDDKEHGWKWENCMDVQILQKILPKLHGSRRKIEPVLVDLARYCEGDRVTGLQSDRVKEGDRVARVQSGKVKPEEFKAEENAGAVFGKSYRKLREMILAVRRDQFVSFIQ